MRISPFDGVPLKSCKSCNLISEETFDAETSSFMSFPTRETVALDEAADIFLKRRIDPSLPENTPKPKAPAFCPSVTAPVLTVAKLAQEYALPFQVKTVSFTVGAGISVKSAKFAVHPNVTLFVGSTCTLILGDEIKLMVRLLPLIVWVFVPSER